MATNTTNLGLTKPDLAEGYDVNVFNANADILDGAVGALLNQLGGADGGLGKKLDTLLDNVERVKNDTSSLVQALATANANINTLLTQTKGVKQIYREKATFTGSSQIKRTIPTGMNEARVIILTSDATNTYNVQWELNGREIIFNGALDQYFTYQIIEFY